MNNKVLIGFFVALLVIFVGLPMASVAKKMYMVKASMSEASGPTEKPPPAPPLLNEGNLTGTAWVVKTPEIPCPVTIALNPGGQATATVPDVFRDIAKSMIGTDTLTGTWSVNGAKLTASVVFQNKTQTVDCDIIGDRIFFKDKEIKRAP